MLQRLATLVSKLSIRINSQSYIIAAVQCNVLLVSGYAYCFAAVFYFCRDVSTYHGKAILRDMCMLARCKLLPYKMA